MCVLVHAMRCRSRADRKTNHQSTHRSLNRQQVAVCDHSQRVIDNKTHFSNQYQQCSCICMLCACVHAFEVMDVRGQWMSGAVFMVVSTCACTSSFPILKSYRVATQKWFARNVKIFWGRGVGPHKHTACKSTGATASSCLLARSKCLEYFCLIHEESL